MLSCLILWVKHCSELLSLYYLIIKWSSTFFFSFYFVVQEFFNFLDFVKDWACACSPCMCKWKWFSFHLVFSEFGEILDLVGQGSGRKSRGLNHYKLSVLNLFLTKISTRCSYQYLSSNRKYSTFIFNHLNSKKCYSPPLAYSKGPNT